MGGEPNSGCFLPAGKKNRGPFVFLQVLGDGWR